MRLKSWTKSKEDRENHGPKWSIRDIASAIGADWSKLRNALANDVKAGKPVPAPVFKSGACNTRFYDRAAVEAWWKSR
jgi:hypothetical protein